MFAADEGHGAVVRLLLEAGADPNLVSLDGQVGWAKIVWMLSALKVQCVNFSHDHSALT